MICWWYLKTVKAKTELSLRMADTDIYLTGSIGHPKSNSLYRTENNSVLPFTSLHSARSRRKSLYSAGV